MLLFSKLYSSNDACSTSAVRHAETTIRKPAVQFQESWKEIYKGKGNYELWVKSMGGPSSFGWGYLLIAFIDIISNSHLLRKSLAKHLWKPQPIESIGRMDERGNAQSVRSKNVGMKLCALLRFSIVQPCTEKQLVVYRSRSINQSIIYFRVVWAYHYSK